MYKNKKAPQSEATFVDNSGNSVVIYGWDEYQKNAMFFFAKGGDSCSFKVTDLWSSEAVADTLEVGILTFKLFQIPSVVFEDTEFMLEEVV